jgi:hypothetical protein
MLLRNVCQRVPEGQHRSKPGTKCLEKGPSKEPFRRVRYDRALLIPEVFLIENSVTLSSNRCAHRHESHRTLRDGSFGGCFPRHFVPGYDRTVPPGHFATGLLVYTRPRDPAAGFTQSYA